MFPLQKHTTKRKTRGCDVRTVAVIVVVVLSVALEAKSFETKDSALQFPQPAAPNFKRESYAKRCDVLQFWLEL